MVQNILWNTKQYNSFGNQRLLPALDLINRVPLENPGKIVDLGCGNGNVTRILHERWPTADITGVDNSDIFLEKAKALNINITWHLSDLNEWQHEEQVDLLFSNAALHWIDNHQAFFPRLIENIKPGGVAAIQMPRNWGAPSHTNINKTIRERGWQSQLASMIKDTPTHPPEYYYECLSSHVQSLEIWETEYIQVLEGENPVADFVKGSWLQRYLQALKEPEKTEFESQYRKNVANDYPKQADGKTLFPFRRLFIIARC